MQWSADRNAGFSRSKPQKLILPIIIDPEYHYESINVGGAAEQLLVAALVDKRLIALRKRYSGLAAASIEFLTSRTQGAGLRPAARGADAAGVATSRASSRSPRSIFRGGRGCSEWSSSGGPVCRDH